MGYCVTFPKLLVRIKLLKKIEYLKKNQDYGYRLYIPVLVLLRSCRSPFTKGEAVMR